MFHRVCVLLLLDRRSSHLTTRVASAIGVRFSLICFSCLYRASPFVRVLVFISMCCRSLMPNIIAEKCIHVWSHTVRRTNRWNIDVIRAAHEMSAHGNVWVSSSSRYHVHSYETLSIQNSVAHACAVHCVYMHSNANGEAAANEFKVNAQTHLRLVKQ